MVKSLFLKNKYIALNTVKNNKIIFCCVYSGNILLIVISVAKYDTLYFLEGGGRVGGDLGWGNAAENL